jgi:putative SOS response-associated peptidase YedK
MSRLYTLQARNADIAAQFDVADPGNLSPPSETIEGNSGLVVLENKGQRLLKSMSWGFPRLTSEMRERGDPPGRIGLVADLTNPMWEQLVVDPRYRCRPPIAAERIVINHSDDLWRSSKLPAGMQPQLDLL